MGECVKGGEFKGGGVIGGPGDEGGLGVVGSHRSVHD